MKSPFPGMDPYIEDCGLWEDFHGHLIEKIYERLADTAPAHYLVRTGERSYLVLVESEGKVSHPFLPDVSVTAPEGRKKTTRKRGGVAVAEPAEETEPVTMRAFIEEEHREAFVEIYEATPEQRLVTCIEVLSASNKRPGSEGRDLYLRKRQSLLLGAANLVEIDLLRGGERMPMLDPWPNSPYTLMVARAKKYQLCKAWPAHFRRPLPRIPAPLIKPDPDLWLDLQPMVDAIYQRSRYERSIDYTRPLSPLLGPEESAWLEQQLRARQSQA
ncbi:MAG: DUF4058 family protein [Planctomycetes bacterium]|nr:DUF4058 family protein [Planctomycetota bacterium]